MRTSTYEIAKKCFAILFAMTAFLFSQNQAHAAITVAQVAAAATTNASTTQATAAFTPVANTLYLMWTIQGFGSTPAVPTVACANGLTMVRVNTVTFDTIATPLGRLTLFRAMKASGLSPGTCTITWNQTTTGNGYSLVSFTGIDTSGTDGSGAVAQSVTGATDNAAAAGLSIALAALQADSASAGGFSNSVNNTASLTAGAGYTAGTGVAFNTPTTSLRAEWDATGVTTVNMTQTGAPSSIGGIAVEVRAAPAPLLAEYRMDEALWNGTANEVVDNSGNGNHAQAFNSASTLGTTAAITGNPGTCNYGVFDNGGTITQGYVQTPLPNLTTDFTVTAWIRTTNNAVGGQRILIDDQNDTGGYGISLGDGVAGILRFFSRGITPIILDSAYTIANNTWYFIAAVADITNKKRTIYVFSAAGALLNTTTEAAWTAGAWGTDAGPVSIGGEVNGPPQTEPPASFHFHGNLDEVRVYQQAMSQAAVTAVATQTHACPIVVAVPNHYELSMPTSSVACLATTVTVTACADATSPCTNPLAAASGTTAILATSGGTLGVTPVTFGATGVASTTLSYPAAPDGTPVTVTLSGEQLAASNPRQWCPNGTGCVVANSGSTTFNTAGFIFSAAAGGGVATIPTQVAGVTSATNYLRAVKTSTTTQACEAALTGTSAVNFAYECNNPTTCYTSNLMSVNGGTATTIARNNNGSVASYLPVNMTFDANGNAPFTFNYSDVGQVRLWASKAASGSLLSTLTGSSNAFVVKPGGFVISNIVETAPPNLVNPAAANAAGPKFVKAGENFTMTVAATTTPASGAATTPNYGRELSPESVKLTSALVAPAGGVPGTLSGTFGAFANGVANGTTFTWSEVGIISLTASVGDADYLGAGDTTGTTTGNVGRFFPDHFDTVVTPQGSPVGFAYSGNPVGPVPGQPFTVTVTARNALGSPTTNYNNAGGFAKNVNLSVPVGGATGQLYVDAVAGGTGAVPAGKFLNLNPGEGKVNYSDATGKISFVFNSLPYYLALPIQIHAEDADTLAPSGANGSIYIRHGRLRLFNAFGSEKANLSMPLQAEYWTGNSWVLNSADNFTLIPAGSIALSGYLGTLSAANLGASHIAGTTLASGQGSIVLAMPSPTATGSVDLAINLGTGAADQSCLAIHPATTGAAIPWLRSINGNCAITYDRDPSARGSFGIYAPETRKTVHVRELF
jgi:MSHA biogenesis protein MshQ